MPDWANVFYHVANPESAAASLVPETSEQQVTDLIDAFHEGLQAAFAPNAGMHALIFGEWGHGKSQVLYRIAAALAAEPRCAALVIVPEELSPRAILAAAVASATKQNLDATILRNAALDIAEIDPTATIAMQRAAKAFSEWASAIGRPHTALLFDEAQTIEGANFQVLLQETRAAFQKSERVLHTLQCHSLVTLDRARQLANDLNWLQGPHVRQVYLGSLNDEQAFELLRNRVRTVSPALADTFIAPGIARTIGRLAGGNPRKILILAQQVADEASRRGGEVSTGDDVVVAATREAGREFGSRLFMPERLRQTDELLEQVWPRPIGKCMAEYLNEHIGHLFGESGEVDIGELASDLDTTVPQLHACLQKPVAGIHLFEVQEDDLLETTVVLLSLAFRTHLGASFAHGGGFDEKRVQFNFLLAPNTLQKDLADGIRGVLQETAAAPPEPLSLGQDSVGELIRAYRVPVQVPNTGYQTSVLVAPILGRTYWPPDAIKKLKEELRLRRSLRIVLFDFVIDADGDHWLEQCSDEGIQINGSGLPNLQRIPFDDWAGELADTEEDEQPPTIAVQSARFCAALIGAAHAIINHLNPSDTQSFATTKIVDLWRSHLPAASAFCYLPSQAERMLLDLAQWQAGEALTLATLKQTSGQNLTGNTLRNLVPHYIAKQGSKWKRQPLLESPLAKAIINALRRHRATPTSREKIREYVEDTIIVPIPGELPNCIEWFLNKMLVEGLIDERLDGFVYIDLERDLKKLRREVKELQSELAKQIDRLSRLDQKRWLNRRRSVEDLKVRATAADAGLSGRAAMEILTSIRDETVVLSGSLQLDAHGAEDEIKQLVSDAVAAEQRLSSQVVKVHAAWRIAFGQVDLQKELRQALETLQAASQESTAEIDALGRTNDAYQRFAARRDALQRRLEDGGAEAGAQRELARAILAGNFNKITATFIEA